MSSDTQLHIPKFVREREKALEDISLVISSALSSVSETDKRKLTLTDVELQEIVGVKVPRRRTASFKTYKMPRVLKEQRRVKKKRGKEIPYMLRCRKHKRRAKYLQEQHNTANTTSKWLHSHIWHKKRMKMEKTWGNLWMAKYNINRGMARNLASATQKHSILHDSSYLQPLQISGGMEDVENLLRHFAEPGAELDSLSNECNVEEDLLLYEKDCFPTRCIGPATSMRMAPTTLWLWLHPSIADRVCMALSNVAQSEGRVTITWLANPPCRFILRGSNVPQLLLRYVKGGKDCATTAFLTDLLSRSERAINKVWPLNYCAGLEASSLVLHPMEMNSSKKKKSLMQWKASVMGAEALSSLVTSSSSREGTTHSCSVILVRKDDSKSKSCCRNVHLVKRSQKLAGFDVILPPGPASVLWHALTMRGADVYPVGYEEMNFLHLCAGIPSFPQDFPETQAGIDLWTKKVAQAEKVCASRPPRWRRATSTASAYASQVVTRLLGEGYVVVRHEDYLAAFEREDEYHGQDEEEKEDQGDEYRLEHPTCVPAIVKPVSRGVPAEGATLYVPFKADLNLFLSYEQDKAKMNLHTGRRLGQWSGAQIDGRANVTREVAGCVTSGVNKTGKGRKNSRGKRLFVPGNLALCLLNAPQLLAAHRDSRAAGIKGRTLMLFRNPGSLILRPAFVHLVGTAK